MLQEVKSPPAYNARPLAHENRKSLIGLTFRSLGIGLRYRAHSKWLRVVGGETTREVLRIYPRLAYRHSTTYLFSGATWAQRLQLLIQHYAFINETFDAAFYNETLGERGYGLWRLSSAGVDLIISLHGPCLVSRHREGELSLKLFMDDVHLYTIAFSIVEDAHTFRRGLFIGQVQGAGTNLDRLRQVSKMYHGIHPRDMLMSALEGLAKTWNATELFGVSDRRQLSKQGDDPPSFDYDAFWRQYRGHQDADGHFKLPLPFHAGEQTGQSSAHRRRTRLKRIAQVAISEAVAAAVKAAMHESTQRKSTAATGRALQG